ncbi:heterokaryon incompatibility protein-domain-containing protein [Xylaria castorea]|nr:heterokaryon incompatibility protein-domain-containing protein [Xylaria castorea]
MRLLNVKTLQLEEHVGSDIPRYSILSHRWEGEEVTFSDLVGGRYSTMKGYQKVIGCCRISRSEGFKYTWIDSCCIDKSSSAELSEAINSMFRWYKNAAVCYAYLSDVHSISDFSASKWFTRGWTLQELIAPDAVVFLNADWQEIGTKASSMAVIAKVTGIDENILGTARPKRDITESLRHVSVARKLSWAATRNTTKVEDTAYCLMGLFDVNMPLIYGEGNKAFQRLQAEIMNYSDDDSIFAWTHSEEEYTGSFSGILADSPCCFSGMNGVDSDSGLSAGLSNMFKTFKNNVKLQISIVGAVGSLLHDTTDSLPLICRVSDSRRSLISTVREEYPEDHTVLDATIGVLQCRTTLGRIVLLLHEHGTDLYSRYHFDGHLYFIQDSVRIEPPRVLKAVLYQRQDHDDPYMPIPAIRLDSRVAKLGYRLWATSIAPTPDEEHKSACWLRARGGGGYILFENRRGPEWPAFMLIYRHEPEDNHFKVYCDLVREDFMPSDAVKASNEVEFQSSRELSELRVQLAENKHLVVKVRVKSYCCDIVLLVQ